MTAAALLGTKYTMTQDFYKSRLTDRGIRVLIPDESDIETVNHAALDYELCLGIISPASREAFVKIIEKLMRQGAQGVILGCTEIGLLIRPADSPLPVFDTTILHAKKAALLAVR